MRHHGNDLYGRQPGHGALHYVSSEEIGAIMKNAALLVIACLIPLQAPLPAADPAQPLFWSSSQNKDFDNQAESKLNPDRHLGTERLLDSAFVTYRNGSGEA